MAAPLFYRYYLYHNYRELLQYAVIKFCLLNIPCFQFHIHYLSKALIKLSSGWYKSTAIKVKHQFVISVIFYLYSILNGKLSRKLILYNVSLHRVLFHFLNNSLKYSITCSVFCETRCMKPANAICL